MACQSLAHPLTDLVCSSGSRVAFRLPIPIAAMVASTFATVGFFMKIVIGARAITNALCRVVQRMFTADVQRARTAVVAVVLNASLHPICISLWMQ